MILAILEHCTHEKVEAVSSGGPAILLPAAALLIGSGILTYAVLRRH